MSWASAVGSKKPDPPPAPPAKPAPAASAAPSTAADQPPTSNGGAGAADAPRASGSAAARPAATPNGGAPPSAPAAAAKPAPAAGAAAPRANKALFSYEPAPNEIMRVTLTKPTTDAKLGIRLAGEEGTRPRIISLNPEGLAAKAKCLQVGDVFLKVSRMGTALCAQQPLLSLLFRFAARELLAPRRARARAALTLRSRRRLLPCAGQRLRGQRPRDDDQDPARDERQDHYHPLPHSGGGGAEAEGRRSFEAGGGERGRGRRGRRRGPCAPARRQRLGFAWGGSADQGRGRGASGQGRCAEASRGGRAGVGRLCCCCDVRVGSRRGGTCGLQSCRSRHRRSRRRRRPARGRRRSRNCRCPSTRRARPCAGAKGPSVAQPHGHRRRRWRAGAAAAVRRRKRQRWRVGGRRRCEGRRQPACHRQGRRQSRRHPQQ